MERLHSYSPVTLEDVGSVDMTPCEDVPIIVEESRTAQNGWSTVSKKDVVSLMRRLRFLIAEESEHIAKTVFDETGKTKTECYNTEVFVSVTMVKYCEQWLKHFKNTEKIDSRPLTGLLTFLGRSSYTEHAPLGTIGVISPYNYPFSIPFTETVMAVAAGNSVILKPSPDTPLCGHLIQELFERAGFPRGLVRAVSGPDVGEMLVASDIDKIIFTGGTRTGRAIMKSASERLTPLILELGGKDAMIVLDDADLDRAVDCGVWGSFVNSGQTCVCIKRIYVQRRIYDLFTERFTEKTRLLKQGDGWADPCVSVGAMINERAVEKMALLCDEATIEGGRILTGGKRNPDLEGFFFEPTVVVGIPPKSDFIRKEIFGPIVTITPFDSVDEAVDLANSTEFALGGSVWTSDIAKGKGIALRMKSGMVNLNTAAYTYGLPCFPWGGTDESGFGTTHGEAGFMELMRHRHIHVDRSRFERDPWWMPYDERSTAVQKEMCTDIFGKGKRGFSALIHTLPLLKRRK